MRIKFFLCVLLFACLLQASDGQYVTCSVDGRLERLSGVGGLAVNYLGCGHIICDQHTHWVEVTGAPWWKFWARHMEPQCPIDGQIG